MNFDFGKQKAFEILENAYCPYSNFPVGSCVVCNDGSYYCGVNIENCAYNSGICAERVALFNATTAGKKADDIAYVVIVSKAQTISYSCAACRQVFVELLNSNTPIVFSNGTLEDVKTVEQLVPYPFTGKDLAV